MLPYRKRVIFAVTALSLMVLAGGCSFGGKKDKKPMPLPSTKVEDGNAKAKGSGEGQSDVPLIIGCGKISTDINPFSKLTVSDKQAVSFTQIKLVTYDRNGQIVYHAIDGEVRPYKDTEYTYYGPADIDVEYNEEKNETVYSVKIREDLKFSNGKEVTIDDVIFTMYALCDASYKGSETFGGQNIKGLHSYLRGKAENIAGINRIDDYSMTITTVGYDKDFVYSLRFPICPLNYYGDIEKYDYENNKFGFTRGDLSSVENNHPSLIGAGAYQFVKNEKGIAYFTSNEMYYRGCPKTAYLQMKEMDKILEADKDLLPPEAVEVYEGTVDIIEFFADAEDFKQIASYDYDGSKSDDVFMMQPVTTETIYTIGINAERVCIGSKSAGKKSKSLRSAFQKAFQDGRESLEGIYGESLKLIEYPCAPDLWYCPNEDHEDEEDDKDEKNIVSYLEDAGYSIKAAKSAKVPNAYKTKAPKGAKTEYSIGIINGRKNPVYPVVLRAAENLKQAGITLKIVPVKNESEMKRKLDKGSLQLWVEEKTADSMRSLFDYYTGVKSYFGIKNAKLKSLLSDSDKMMTDEERKECYKQCFESVAKQHVDIPIFQQCKTVLVSSKRMKGDKITNDMTPYYNWIDEIHLIKR